MKSRVECYEEEKVQFVQKFRDIKVDIKSISVFCRLETGYTILRI